MHEKAGKASERERGTKEWAEMWQNDTAGSTKIKKAARESKQESERKREWEGWTFRVCLWLFAYFFNTLFKSKGQMERMPRWGTKWNGMGWDSMLRLAELRSDRWMSSKGEREREKLWHNFQLLLALLRSGYLGIRVFRVFGLICQHVCQSVLCHLTHHNEAMNRLGMGFLMEFVVIVSFVLFMAHESAKGWEGFSLLLWPISVVITLNVDEGLGLPQRNSETFLHGLQNIFQSILCRDKLKL